MGLLYIDCRTRGKGKKKLAPVRLQSGPEAPKVNKKCGEQGKGRDNTAVHTASYNVAFVT